VGHLHGLHGGGGDDLRHILRHHLRGGGGRRRRGRRRWRRRRRGVDEHHVDRRLGHLGDVPVLREQQRSTRDDVQRQRYRHQPPAHAALVDRVQVDQRVLEHGFPFPPCSGFSGGLGLLR